MTRRWVLTAIFCSLIATGTGRAKKEESLEEVELEDGEAGETCEGSGEGVGRCLGEYMRSVWGETGSELSWDDLERLLSEGESFSLGELTISGAEFE